MVQVVPTLGGDQEMGAYVPVKRESDNTETVKRKITHNFSSSTFHHHPLLLFVAFG
jgi:hypothetical protein